MSSTPDNDVSEEELEQEGEPLPDRELPSLIDSNVVIPVNAAVAANVLAEDSLAEGEAEQNDDADQTTQ
jgi:hypothetical protein